MADETRRARLGRLEWLLLFVIVLGGFALRVAAFQDVPPGVIHDEVRNWLNVQLIYQGDLRALYPYGGGRECFYLLIKALSFRRLDDNLLAASLPSIACSTLGIPISISLGRR
ncbi:MAG: hypothetical protein GYB68_18965, partial [Chloroflexi bacterium]|nr:hypothetical protein [Chloroflexota bacterium]